MVREACYSILWCMSRLDVHFYGLDELPGPLALALFADAHALSSHQMSILLNMTRYIIDDCPTTLRAHFLTPLLASLFAQVDRKISGEWNELIEKGQITQGDDKLAEEMKEESILRQLTYTAVLIVAGLLDPQRPGEPVNAASGFLSQLALPEMQSAGPGEQTMREFILSSDSVLEPLILFCTHALRMRDSRCCGIIIRVFRSIVPEFQADRADIREFICREVLMAAIDVGFHLILTCLGNTSTNVSIPSHSMRTTLSMFRKILRNSSQLSSSYILPHRRHHAAYYSRYQELQNTKSTAVTRNSPQPVAHVINVH